MLFNVWKAFISLLYFDCRINGYGFFLSLSWTMPTSLCIVFFSRLLREQWIRAKYERKEFIHSEKQEPYSAGSQRNFGRISVLVSITIPFSCLRLYLLHIDYCPHVTKKV